MVGRARRRYLEKTGILSNGEWSERGKVNAERFAKAAIRAGQGQATLMKGVESPGMAAAIEEMGSLALEDDWLKRVSLAVGGEPLWEQVQLSKKQWWIHRAESIGELSPEWAILMGDSNYTGMHDAVVMGLDRNEDRIMALIQLSEQRDGSCPWALMVWEQPTLRWVIDGKLASDSGWRGRLGEWEEESDRDERLAVAIKPKARGARNEKDRKSLR